MLKFDLEQLSPDYKYLLNLGRQTDDERGWSYHLAKNILLYRFSWWNPQQQKAVREEISSDLASELIGVSVRNQGWEYVRKLGIAVPAPIVASIIDERRFSQESSNYIYLAQKPPTGCRGCNFFHGQMYNGELLVCAIHPSGQDNCPDYQEKIDRVK